MGSQGCVTLLQSPDGNESVVSKQTLLADISRAELDRIEREVRQSAMPLS